MSRVACSFCAAESIVRTFATPKSYRQHCKASHPKSRSDLVKQICKCYEATCSFVSRKISDLANHLDREHSHTEFRTQKLFFVSVDAFTIWKQEIETRTLCQYNRHTGAKSTRNGDLRLEYFCFRSTKSTKVEDAFRCTARILMLQTDTGECSVTACLEHYGHDLNEDVPKQSLTDNFREEVARRLKMKVAPRDVLRDLRNSAWDECDAGGSRSRAMYAVLQDIYNIRRQFKLQTQAVDQSESISLRAEATHQLGLPTDLRTLLFLKNPGEELTGYPSLTQSHFLALIQTSFQREMLRRHGSKGVSIDATHGIARDKKVKLITLLVLDDCERGIPVAHLLTNHEDTVSVQIFFHELKDQLVPLNVQWFLSDDADAFFNAWNVVIGGVTKKILCIWHVLKNVNQKLYGYIRNSGAALVVIRLFRAVMYAHTLEICTTSVLALQTAVFGHPAASKYLADWYLSRIEQWALIHRVGSQLSTSGHIESYHRVLKRDHLQSVSANRLDDLLFSTVNFARETRIKRSVFAAKNVPSSRMRAITSRHRHAVDQQANYEIYRDDSTRWICTKITVEQPTYVLTIKSCSILSCGIGCAGCANFCIHRIYCGCPEALGGFRYCKHAHLLCIELMKPQYSKDLLDLMARPQQFSDNAFTVSNVTDETENVWETEYTNVTSAASVYAVPSKLLSEKAITDRRDSVARFMDFLVATRTMENDRLITNISSYVEKLSIASRLDKTIYTTDAHFGFQRKNCRVTKQQRRHVKKRHPKNKK